MLDYWILYGIPIPLFTRLEHKVTVREAARTLGVTYDYLLRELWAGRLNGRKHGRTWTVDDEAVRERVARKSQSEGETVQTVIK